MFKSYKRICLSLKLLCWPLFTVFCVSNTSAHATFYSYTSRPEVIYFQKRDNDIAHLLYCRNLLDKLRKTISLRTEEYRLKQKFREKYRLHWLQKITMIKIWQQWLNKKLLLSIISMKLFLVFKCTDRIIFSSSSKCSTIYIFVMLFLVLFHKP